MLARSPSAAYRARKFVRRNTWGVAAGAVATLALVAFGATMAIQANRIATQRDAAEQAQADLESVVDFQAGMLASTDPEEMGRRLMADLERRVAEVRRAGGSTEAEAVSAVAELDALTGKVNATNLALRLIDEDILGRAVAKLDEEFKDRPLIDARLRGTIGNTYREIWSVENLLSELAVISEGE